MPRGKKKKAEEVVEEPSTKKQKQKPVGIDMSHVPASLRLEGYKSDEEERENDKVIPDYLKCPICKEIFVNPEIYKCGHTVCKLCSDDNCNCPVCKRPDQRTTAPNYTLKSVIENQYADLVKDRQKEQDELLNIRNKMKEYPRSARYREIRKYAQIYLTNKVIVSVDDFISYLTTSIKALKNSPIKSPISSEEAKFSIALLVSNNLCHFVGQYIVSVIEINEFLRRAKIQEETANKKKTNKTKMTEPSVNLKSWISIVIYYHYSRERTILPSGQFVVNLKENAKQIASLSNLDIGEFVSVEEWKNQPSFWVKDVVLGELETLFLPRNLCGCGRIHHDFEDSDDDDSDSDSDDW